MDEFMEAFDGVVVVDDEEESVEAVVVVVDLSKVFTIP